MNLPSIREQKPFSMALSLLLAICPLLAFGAGSSNESWFESDNLVSEEANYLSTHSLYPFIEGGKTEYIATGFAEHSADNQRIAFPIGKILQQDVSYEAMFLAKRGKNFNDMEVRLLCIAKDQLPSPLLFNDILSASLPMIRKALPNFHVFIEQLESVDLPKDQILERWVFFTPTSIKELHVSLTPDGQGGTYFAITDPEGQ